MKLDESSRSKQEFNLQDTNYFYSSKAIIATG